MGIAFTRYEATRLDIIDTLIETAIAFFFPGEPYSADRRKPADRLTFAPEEESRPQ